MKIIVNSEKEKKIILKESKYIHDLKCIDSDKAGLLMHIYSNPNIIEVVDEIEDEIDINNNINELNEFIEYCCSTGRTPEHSKLFTNDALLAIEFKAAGGSDKKIEKIIRTIWEKKQK